MDIWKGLCVGCSIFKLIKVCLAKFLWCKSLFLAVAHRSPSGGLSVPYGREWGPMGHSAPSYKTAVTKVHEITNPSQFTNDHKGCLKHHGQLEMNQIASQIGPTVTRPSRYRGRCQPDLACYLGKSFSTWGMPAKYLKSGPSVPSLPYNFWCQNYPSGYSPDGKHIWRLSPQICVQT